MHNFSVKTFRKPTYCDHCSGLLWGLARQGLSCAQCHLNMHGSCMAEVADSIPCPQSSRRHSISGADASLDTLFDKQSTADSGVVFESTVEMAQNIKGEKAITTASDGKDTPSLLRQRSLLFNLRPGRTTSTTSRKSMADIKQTSSAESGLQSVAPQRRSGSVIHDLLEKTAEKAEGLKKKQPPKLNFLTTLPKNFTRFVMRVGPMAELHGRIEDVFAWKSTTETLLVMALYTLICLNPFLLILMPNLLIVGLISDNYYKNITSAPKRHRQTKSDASLKSVDSGKAPTVPEDINYMKNMQFIQNFMGTFCEAYEAVISLNKWVNWSDPAITKNILLASVTSSFVLLFAFTWIPWNIMFLFVGLCAFCSKSAFVQAMAELAVNSAQQFSETLTRKHHWLVSENKPESMNDCDPTSKTVTVELYENQRWWAGLGWISHMLRNERSAWSAAHGKKIYKNKDSYDSPSHLISNGQAINEQEAELIWKWKWTGDWQIDHDYQIGVDEQGWHYTDYKWMRVDKRSGGAFVTRSRRWIRKAAPMAIPTDV